MELLQLAFQTAVSILTFASTNSNIQDDYDRAARFNLAAQEGNITLIQDYLDNNIVNVDVLYNGSTALLWAADNNHTEVMKILLNYHADINFVSKNNSTALMICSYYGNEDGVRLLLERHALTDIANANGNTALMRATMHGHTNIVKLLLEYRADTTPTNNNGETALDLARKFNLRTIISLLEEPKV